MLSGIKNKIKKNKYAYFFAKLGVLLIVVFILDFSIGNTLRYFYFKQQAGRQFRATYAIEKTTADVLIFGSSRAYHHYDPSIIESELKQSCYNTGSPGQFLLYNYATLRAVLKRYNPKLIVLDISQRDMNTERESYDRLSFLLPYYADHKEIRPIVNLKSPLEKYKMISSIYAYNSSLLMIAGGNMDYFKQKASDIKGFKPLDRIWKDSIEVIASQQFKLDTIKANVFKSFISDCQQSGVNLVIVCSPTYQLFNQRDASIQLADSIAVKNNVKFIDFTNDTTFTNHPQLFDDPGHLNNKGADIFTHVLLDKIKDSLHF